MSPDLNSPDIEHLTAFQLGFVHAVQMGRAGFSRDCWRSTLLDRICLCETKCTMPQVERHNRLWWLQIYVH